MRLYRISYQIKKDDVIDTDTIWAGSQSESSTRRRIIRQLNGYVPNSVQTEQIDVPTSKVQLIDFLNKMEGAKANVVFGN